MIWLLFVVMAGAVAFSQLNLIIKMTNRTFNVCLSFHICGRRLFPGHSFFLFLSRGRKRIFPDDKCEALTIILSSVFCSCSCRRRHFPRESYQNDQASCFSCGVSTFYWRTVSVELAVGQVTDQSLRWCDKWIWPNHLTSHLLQMQWVNELINSCMNS